MFYKDTHKIIYQSVLDLFNEGNPIDMLTVCNKLKSNGKLEIVGGPYFIGMLSEHKNALTVTTYHCMIVKQKYLLREIISISSNAIKHAYNDDTDLFVLLARVVKQFEELHDAIQQSKTIHSADIFSNIISDTVSDTPKSSYRILTTGEDELDKRFTLQTNEQLLVAAKSGAGKTSWLIWYIKTLLERYHDQVSVNWFCMEDSLVDMIINMLAGDVLKSNAQIKAKELNAEEKDILEKRKFHYDKYDIEFHDQPTSIDTIYSSHVSFCKKRTERFNILVVDNVMTLTDNDGNNQNNSDNNISKKLIRTRKNCAAISDSAIIVLHHYNDKQLEKENLKIAYRPNEKDIRGSTRYRDCSTIILLMNNPENYNDLLSEYKDDVELLKALMLFEITKNRLGKLGALRSLKTLEYKLFKFLSNE